MNEDIIYTEHEEDLKSLNKIPPMKNRLYTRKEKVVKNVEKALLEKRLDKLEHDVKLIKTYLMENQNKQKHLTNMVKNASTNK